MLKIIDWNGLDSVKQRELLLRPAQQEEGQIVARVQQILQDVRAEGDAALRRLTQELDGVELESPKLPLDQAKALANQLDPAVRKAIDTAYQNIRQFHAAQQPKNVTVQTTVGVQCELRYEAIQSVGLYIPGGSAVLPSTVLMLGVPAQLAGCRRVVLTSPPNAEAELSPAVCYAALKCGIQEFLLLGGAQAVAALAYGTESITAVDKIFGPGNAYVTAAKTLVSAKAGGPAIDMPAGPSELLVIADQSATPAFLAADLLSQAEHGPDSQVILLATDQEVLKQTAQQVQLQLARLPRKEIAAQALEYSRLILVSDLAEAAQISNQYAPEHLSLQVAETEDLLAQIWAAGSVFVGHYTPESGGDYATGTNHVLPTYGAGRAYSSLGLLDFYRRFTVQQATKQGLRQLAPTIITLAAEEGLEAHLRAVTVRLEELS